MEFSQKKNTSKYLLLGYEAKNVLNKNNYKTFLLVSKLTKPSPLQPNLTHRLG